MEVTFPGLADISIEINHLELNYVTVFKCHDVMLFFIVPKMMASWFFLTLLYDLKLHDPRRSQAGSTGTSRPDFHLVHYCSTEETIISVHFFFHNCNCTL